MSTDIVVRADRLGGSPLLEKIRVGFSDRFGYLTDPPIGAEISATTHTVDGSPWSIEVTYNSPRPLARLRTVFTGNTNASADLPLVNLARFVLDHTPDVPVTERDRFVQDLFLTLTRVTQFHSPLTVDGTPHPGTLIVFGGFCLHHAVLDDRAISLITADSTRPTFELATR